MGNKIKKRVGKEARKFHYTIGKHLPEIIQTVQINMATAGCLRKREYAAWVSTNQLWEETANKSYRANGYVYKGNRQPTHIIIGGGLARIEVNSRSAPYSWRHYVKKRARHRAG